jgi:DNA polymerase-1
MKIKATTKDAYDLFHQGTLTLAEIEGNGMRIDTHYLKETIKKIDKKIVHLSEKIKKDEVFKVWKKTFGAETNLGSHDQLATVLFDKMKYKCEVLTEKGKPKTDETVLDNLNIPFVKDYRKISKLKKARSTNLLGIQKETVNGFLHPFFSLNTVQTFRSSSEKPNFQNIPVRDPEIKELVRRAFVARPNHRIIENDYSGAEIGSATCYHHDPTMIHYIETEPGKLHTDMASKCFLLSIKEVEKDAKEKGHIRYAGKNMFVFPQFYGDTYIHCAKNLWEAISQLKLKTANGESLKEHLKSKGITKLGKCIYDSKPLRGTFEAHLQKVEYDFWNKRFKVYNQWKIDWWREYQKRGKFRMLTGFEVSGFLKRNEVINYPIQGTAFHWLLWSLIQIQKLLRKYKMRTKLTGQIHDSIVADVYKKEVKDYLEIVKQVMTIDIRKHWRWIIIPLRVEAEASPIGGSWYEKEEIRI